LVGVDVNEERSLLLARQSYVKLKRRRDEKWIPTLIAGCIEEAMVSVHSTHSDFAIRMKSQ